jgi:ATP-dependent Clp protease ATP-binding subunit ClpC
MRSQKEAHALGAEEIAPEHLLLGLTGVERGTAAQALAALGVDLDGVRREVGGEAVREPSRGRLPFTNEAKAVLESSLREALSLNHNWIGSEHILLSLLEAGGRPVEILEKLGAEPDAIRAEINRLLEAAA